MRAFPNYTHIFNKLQGLIAFNRKAEKTARKQLRAIKVCVDRDNCIYPLSGYFFPLKQSHAIRLSLPLKIDMVRPALQAQGGARIQVPLGEFGSGGLLFGPQPGAQWIVQATLPATGRQCQDNQNREG